MDTQEISRRVLKVVTGYLDDELSAELALSSTIIEAVGADDIDHIELFMDLEEEFDILIPDRDAAATRTIQDIVRCVRRLLKAGTSDAAHKGAAF
jgi:acyl carrier protein